ncbi:MAG TPA: hypothetical protein VMW85_02415 [Methanomassiliicoccales archaeon]|nr:hypothetical protein [Methanomassiliicoccales archaeon]
MNVPSLNSENARSISSLVFITMGPPHAIGSRNGSPDTRMDLGHLPVNGHDIDYAVNKD